MLFFLSEPHAYEKTIKHRELIIASAAAWDLLLSFSLCVHVMELGDGRRGYRPTPSASH